MLQIDYRDGRPLYEQVVDGLESLAARGVLASDSQLPSVRQLAMELSVNPNTIQKAYSELESRGIIYSIKGRGNFVSTDSQKLRDRKLLEFERKISDLLMQVSALGATKAEICTMLKKLLEQHEKGEQR